MDSISDDAQLTLQQLFQLEIDLRTSVDNIRENNEPAPYTTLQAMRQKLNHLRVKANEQTFPEAESFVREQYKLHSDELDTLQRQLRNALNVRAEKEDKQNRDDLFHSFRKRVKPRDAGEIAQDVTNRMQRNTQLLAAMVRQQEETVKTLATSSDEVTEVGVEYSGLSAVLTTSSRLVTKYGRRVMTDTFLTYLGFFLFLCTVLYVIQKRLF